MRHLRLRNKKPLSYGHFCISRRLGLIVVERWFTEMEHVQGDAFGKIEGPTWYCNAFGKIEGTTWY